MAPKQADDSVTLVAFLTSWGLNLSIFIAIVFVFWLFKRPFYLIYFPRWMRTNGGGSTTEKRKWKLRDPTVIDVLTPAPPEGFWSLLVHVATVPDSMILACVGLDAYMYVRVVKLLTRFFALVAGLFGLAVLLPVNATGPGFPEARTSDFDIISIGNIPQGSPRLWAHALSVWLFSIGLAALVVHEYRHFLPLRYAWLAVPQPSRFTTLFLDLPPSIDTDAALYRLADGLYPGQVHTVCMATRATDLVACSKQREDTARRLYRLHWRIADTARMYGPGDGRVLALQSELQGLRDKLAVRDMRLWTFRHFGVRDVPRQSQCHAALTHSPRHGTLGGCNRPGEVAHARVRHRGVYAPLPAGFVTWVNLATAAIAPQVCVSSRALGLRELAIRRAPEPRDIIWSNVGILRRERTVRLRAAGVLAFALTLVYLPLTSLISTLVSLSSIAQVAPWLIALADARPWVRAVLEGWVPSLVLSLILLLVPVFMRCLAVYGGSRSHSEATLAVFRWTFLYSVFVSFFVFTISGTLWTAIDDIVQSPLNTTTILATSLPKLAAFFAQFILFQALVGIPLAHLRLWPIIMHALCSAQHSRRWRAWTSLDRVELREWVAGTFPLEDRLASALVIFVIACVYASMNPVVPPCAVLYYLIASWTARFAVLYCAEKEFETGGAFWPLVASRLFVGIFVYQLTMLGLLGLKEAPGPSAAIFPLPFLTFIFSRWLDKGLRRDSEQLPLDAARNPDLLLSRGRVGEEGEAHGGVSARAWAWVTRHCTSKRRSSQVPSSPPPLGLQPTGRPTLVFPSLPSSRSGTGNTVSSDTLSRGRAALLGTRGSESFRHVGLLAHDFGAPSPSPFPASHVRDREVWRALVLLGPRALTSLHARAGRARALVRSRHAARAEEAAAGAFREAVQEQEEQGEEEGYHAMVAASGLATEEASGSEPGSTPSRAPSHSSLCARGAALARLTLIAQADERGVVRTRSLAPLPALPASVSVQEGQEMEFRHVPARPGPGPGPGFRYGQPPGQSTGESLPLHPTGTLPPALAEVGQVDDEHVWAYNAQRSVYLRPCFRSKFDLPYRPDVMDV